MADTNVTVISGRIVRDSEMKYTNSGTAVANFSLASSSYSGKGNEDYTNYFDCVLWGKRAEGLNQYLTKGKPLIIQGELRQERWEGESGKRSRVKITVLNLTFQQGSKDGGGGGRKEYSDEPVVGGPEYSDSDSPEQFDDSIPF